MMRRQPMLALSAAIGLTVACGGGFLSRAARAENDPVYVVKNGEVDQHVYNGFRRYGEACLRCHGPDGAGSSYAPNLTESLKRLSYDDVVNVIINGRKNVNSANNNVMPSFGTTEDVVNYIDDIYGYLKARSDGQLGRGRPKRIGEDD
jgi:methanol metabolism-related c-type cytochrome